MQEKQFLRLLEERAEEYKEHPRDAEGGAVKILSSWLGVHPWRVIVPAAILGGFGMAVLLRGWLLVLVSKLQGGF